MVVCKYFQQGTCRYGQYCRFQHVNNFAGNPGNNNKQFVEGKNIVLGVAEEVLAAERGGQWLLSCFGPLKEQPCIPGMDDVSPEEVRWEMYQAQKNGTVDQTKLQFQQLCQAMTAKREALKNPTHETVAMLEKLQKTNRSGTFGGKGNFALSSPQLGQSASPSANVFGAKSFGQSVNPFGGGFNTMGGTSSSIFGRSTTSNATVFGGKPSFGNGSVFGAQTSSNSVFGGNQANMQTFAAANSSSNNPVFGGGGSQQVFAQSSTFGATSQANGPFSMSQAATPSSNSLFGGTTTTATSGIFGSSSNSIFGGSKNTPGIFGGGSSAQTGGNSIFASQAGGTSTSSTTIGSTSIFAQPKNTAAFGGAPVFGTTSSFGGPQAPFSSFAGQASFDNPTITTSNVFGSGSAQSNTFGSNSQGNANFGSLASSAFGAVAVSTKPSTPFAGTTGPFGTTTAAAAAAAAAASSPFGGNSAFGGSIAASGESPFASAANNSGAFGTVTSPNSQPFGAPNFANSPNNSFASTTNTTTTSNPFAPRSQQQANTPFGIAKTTMASGSPFGERKSSSIMTASIIDETAFTIEGKLTDDEKRSYLSEQFVLGKIPIKPPTVDLR